MRRMLLQSAGTLKACALVAACCSMIGVTHAESTATDSSVASFTFRDGVVHQRKVTEQDGLLIAEHDIIMQKAGTQTRRLAVGLNNTSYGQLWPNGLVPYRIGADLNDDIRQRIQDAVDHWNSVEAITLVERTSSNASAYPHYIDFVYEDRCASWIGFQASGPQAVYAGDRCTTGTMIHEIGHALGLLHEHTRPDRDQHVQVHWDRIEDNMDVNFEVLEGSVLLGEYDYGSIMHYGEYFFSRNGLPTIEPLVNTSEQIGQRISTSPGDRESVASLYETDLTLVASTAAQVATEEAIELTLQMTNNTQQGANTLSIQVPLPQGISLQSYRSSNWSCFEQNDIAVCEAHVLAGASTTTVTLSLSGLSADGVPVFEATLDSRTRDTNPVDNSDSTSTNRVAIANVDTNNAELSQADATPELASALDGGSGSADLRMLAVLLMLLTLLPRRIHGTVNRR